MHAPLPKSKNLSPPSKWRKNFLWFWSFIVLAQCAIWPSWDGFWGALAVLSGGSFGLFFCLRRQILLCYPISTSIILGFTLYYFILPPLVTIVEIKPLTTNLESPNLVFLHSLICLTSLILAHNVYRSSRILNTAKSITQEKIYKPLGFFRTPSNAQLILIGIIGLTAMAAKVFFGGTAQGGGTEVFFKILHGIYPLSYAPYCILIKSLVGGKSETSKKWLLILTLYTLALAIIAVGSNSRANLFMGIMSIFLAYTYGVLTGLLPLISLKKIVLSILAIFSLSTPATDLAISMIVVRQQRVETSAFDLISETLKAYQDKEGLRVTKSLLLEDVAGWDETYVENVFFARISNLKFPDNSIALAANLTATQVEQLRSIELQRVISILPTPLISLFGLSVDKAFVNSGSGGDFLYATATGNRSGIGAFRTGSIFASGYSLFGWLYPCILFIICTITFPLIDSSTKIVKLRSNNPYSLEATPIFNTVTIATFFSWVFYLTSAATGIEAMSDLGDYALRGWLQTLLIYTVAYWTSYQLLILISSRRKQRQAITKRPAYNSSNKDSLDSSKL